MKRLSQIAVREPVKLDGLRFRISSSGCRRARSGSVAPVPAIRSPSARSAASCHLTGWRAVGASVAGSSHLARNGPCEDEHGWALLPDGALVLAAADGAGAARFARYGRPGRLARRSNDP